MASTITCLERFADTCGDVAVLSTSLHADVKVCATGKILEHTTGVCRVVAVLIPVSSNVRYKAETSHRISPPDHR